MPRSDPAAAAWEAGVPSRFARRAEADPCGIGRSEQRTSQARSASAARAPLSEALSNEDRVPRRPRSVSEIDIADRQAHRLAGPQPGFMEDGRQGAEGVAAQPGGAPKRALDRRERRFRSSRAVGNYWVRLWPGTL